MKKSLFTIKYKLTGANKERALRTLNQNNIVVKNLTSGQNGEIFYFETDASYQEKISQLLENYSLQLISQSRLYNLGKTLKRSIVSLIVFALCLCSIPVYNMFVWNIKVEGVSEAEAVKIKNAVKDEHVKFGALKASVNVNDVNGFVLATFDDISICSSVIYGTTLVLNVQEKIGIEQKEYQSVYARYDGIVESVSITSGTSNVKIGDIVKAGDPLILAHINRGDSLISCPALGEIKVRSFATFNKQFLLKEQKLVRTGNTFYVNYFTMFKNFVKIKCKKVQFDCFETEVLEKEEIGFLIPMKLYKTCVYELTPITITRDFNEEREGFLTAFKLEVEAELSDFSISKITDEVSECEGGYNFKLTCEFMCTY